MTFSRIRTILIALSAVILFIFLFVQIQVVDSERHNQYTSNLRRLNEIDAILNQDLLRLRFELLTHSDPLADELAEMDNLQSVLKQIPTYIDQEGQAEINQALAAYNEIFEQKKSLVEDFKSQNGILKNSLRFFPSAVSDLTGYVFAGGGDQELIIELNNLLRTVLQYTVIASEELAPEIAAQIETLSQNRERYSALPTVANSDVDTVLDHAETILARKPATDAMIREVLAAPTTQRAEELRQVYDRHYESALSTVEFYRLLLYLASLILVAYVATYIIIRMRRSTTALNAAKEELEEALESIQQAEARYRSIFEGTTEGVFQATPDPKGRYLSANPALARIYGYGSPQELLANLTNIGGQLYVDPNRRATFIELAQRHGNVSEFESQAYRKDGRVIWISENVHAVHNADGELVHYEGIVQDITERKQLSEQIQASLERRAHQIQTSAEVAQEVAAALALDDLFSQVVTLVQARFGYAHVHLYSLKGDRLIMQAGTGEVGGKMKEAGYKIALAAETSPAARAARRGESILIADVSQDSEWSPTPLLSDTKSELAVPIKLGDQVLGVLDVQQNNQGARLSDEDQILLIGLCGQIATAIESTRLRRELEERLRELSAYYRAQSHEGWEVFRAFNEQATQAFVFDQTIVQGTTWDKVWTAEVGQAAQEKKLVSSDSATADRPTVAAPLVVPGGELVGVLGVRDDPQKPLSSEEKALIEAISQQVALALEGARLSDQTQEALLETQALQQLSQKLAGTLQMDEILDIFFRACTEDIGFEYIQFSLVDQTQHRIKAIAGAGISESQIKRSNHSLDSADIMADVIRSGQTEI
ncbi:MAG: GAF domain-containing protein, partial [Nitrososphaera sp.]|nr:GAF domain-containing protein [Nitrososphaera sp.]